MTPIQTSAFVPNTDLTPNTNTKPERKSNMFKRMISFAVLAGLVLALALAAGSAEAGLLSYTDHQPGSIDLTTYGMADWALYGFDGADTTPDEYKSGGSGLNALEFSGVANLASIYSDKATVSWTDGTVSTTSGGAIYTNVLRTTPGDTTATFTTTVAASPTENTLYVFFSEYRAAQLTASLGDGSATDIDEEIYANKYHAIEIPFASNDFTTLTVTLRAKSKGADNGSMRLQGLALAEPVVSPVTSLGYWNNGSTGDWSAAAANWNTASDGSGSDVTWNGNETSTAVFSADTSAPGPLAVTIDGSVGVGLIQFRDDDVTLTGGAIDNSAANGSLELDAAAGRTAAIASNISLGAGGLTKSGDGTVILSGTNSYTGPTNVDVGTLQVDSALPSGSPVTVASGATLSGIGTIGGLATISGIHAPGDSPGVQTFPGGLTYNGSSTLQWELIGNTTDLRGTNFDGVNVTGGLLTIETGANSDLIFDVGSTVDWSDVFWDSDQSWLVFDNAGAPSLLSPAIFDTINVSVDSFGQPFSEDVGSFAWGQQDDDVYLNFTAAAVPEPSTFAIATLALIGLAFFGRRKRR